MGLFSWLFGKKVEVKEEKPAKVGVRGYDVYVHEGPPSPMTEERRHVRDLRRLDLCAKKMKEMEDSGVKPNDPKYEEWAIEYQERALKIRKYNQKRRTK